MTKIKLLFKMLTDIFNYIYKKLTELSSEEIEYEKYIES